MTKNRTTKKDSVPPQLLGVLRDALEIGATAFRLEPNPPHIMAVFSTGSQAAEIDFERWAGQEMIDYLRGQITDRKTKSGIFVLGDGGKQYRCRVTVDHMRSPKRVEVMWA